MSSSLLKSDSESDARSVSVSSSGSKGAYRVRVCLKMYFTDQRRRALVLVSARRRVRWLERRLRELFSLRDAFYLTTGGHLLPSAEPLAILHPDDLVQVIPTTKCIKDAVQDLEDRNTGQVDSVKMQTETYNDENYISNGLHHSPNPEGDPAEYEESDNSLLENYKKQALALLEQNCFSQENLGSRENNKKDHNDIAENEFNCDIPARKRRRVRSRKRTKRISGNDWLGVEGGWPGPAESAGSPAVLRERAEGSRAPRLVHATR